MGLISKQDIQSVIVKLDKNKPREREFRQYLDDNVKYGIDRKETILRMWEFISNKDSMINTNLNVAPVEEVEEIDNILKEEDLKNSFDEADFDSI